MATVAQQRDSAVVLTTMGSRGDWAQVSRNPQRDLPVSGAMGKASSVALGLALAQPGVKVILFDGDGSLLMNLGALIAIASKAPGNLYHFVMENGVYATTGGQPIPGQGRISLAKLALAAGYPAAYEFDDLEEFSTRAADILSQPWARTCLCEDRAGGGGRVPRHHPATRRPADAAGPQRGPEGLGRGAQLTDRRK